MPVLAHGSILSRNEASSKPGSIQLANLYQELVAGEIAQKYLAGTGIRVDGTALKTNDTLDLPIGTLSTVEFAHLFSVFNNSRVHQQAEKSNGIDDAPPGLYFSIINRHLIQSPGKNRLGLYATSDGYMDLFIDGLHVDHYFLNEHTTPPMLGTVAFILCAITAHLAGLSQISLVAAGGQGFKTGHIGYKVWPKLGFNAPLEPGEVSRAAHLAHCKTVLDVVSTDPTWWENHGSQRLMAFDLSADSASWQKMLSYAGSKLSNGRLP